MPLVKLGLLDPRVRLDLQDLQAQLVQPDLPGLQDLPVQLDLQDLQAQQGPLVPPGLQDLQARPVQPDQPGLLGLPVRAEALLPPQPSPTRPARRMS